MPASERRAGPTPSTCTCSRRCHANTIPTSSPPESSPTSQIRATIPAAAYNARPRTAYRRATAARLLQLYVEPVVKRATPTRKNHNHAGTAQIGSSGRCAMAFISNVGPKQFAQQSRLSSWSRKAYPRMLSHRGARKRRHHTLVWANERNTLSVIMCVAAGQPPNAPRRSA